MGNALAPDLGQQSSKNKPILTILWISQREGVSQLPSFLRWS